MRDPGLEDEILGARAYEALHVPALFAEWCPRVLDAAGVGEGHRVLDVACGTGVLARAAAARVGDAGIVVGVDPGRGMLAVARELSPRLMWRQAPAESLPFPERAFDAVVSQFGLMFFSDRERALREMGRTLKPGGAMAVAVWDTLENTEPYRIAVDMLARMAGDEAAAALRAPFVLGDAKPLAELFESAGLRSVAVRTITGKGRFPSVRTMVEADLRGWLPVMGVYLDEEQIAAILDEAESALAAFVTDDGEVEFDSPAHIVTATVP